MGLSLVDLLGSVCRSSLFVCLQVGSFRSILLFNDDGYSFDALVLQALAQQLLHYLLQQVLPGSGEEGATTAARLRLASVLVVVARWSTDLNVIFIISSVRCITMIKGE